MADQAALASCVEINLNIFDGRYLADLQVDGMVKQQMVFKTELQVIDWTSRILCMTGPGLYVRMRTEGIRHRQRALELARKLSLPGLMIGIAGQRSVCRTRNRRLQ